MTTEDNVQMADQISSSKNVSWSSIFAALLGIIGGALSGGIAAFVQLSTAEQGFSIERAKEFQSLMDKLQSEETSRLAVLNLWQLYPDERDRKIIIAAALAVGQPDLVELISGIDEEPEPIAEILEARASSDEASQSEPALQTLLQIAPARAARVMIDKLKAGMNERKIGEDYDRLPRPIGEKHKTKQILKDELERLAEKDEIVFTMIENEIDKADSPSMLFQYVLYRASNDQRFIKSFDTAYRTKNDLEKFSDYLRRAKFREADRTKIVSFVSKYIVGALENETADPYEIAAALEGLNIDGFAATWAELDDSVLEDFVNTLRDIIASSKRDHDTDLMQSYALELLGRISPSDALLGLADVLSEKNSWQEISEMGSQGFFKAIKKELKGILLGPALKDDPKFFGPNHCKDVAENSEALLACIKNAGAWTTWLDSRSGE